MKYVDSIADEADLVAANESMFGLQTMYETPFEQFVKYYKIDEMSESEDNDFEEDGRTLQSDVS